MPRAYRAHRVLLTVALTIGTLVGAVFTAASLADTASPSVSFACHTNHCGMPEQGAYQNLVVGRVAAVADAAQAASLFDGMRRRGRWSTLPAGANVFWKNLQPVAIDAGHGPTMVTLTSQDEVHAAPLHVGDFVRYSPHFGRYEKPPADRTAAAFWGVDGCVAVLCRASDTQCMKRYVSGLFRAGDGVQLLPRTLAPLPNGIVIDAQTMLPRNAEPAN